MKKAIFAGGGVSYFLEGLYKVCSQRCTVGDTVKEGGTVDVQVNKRNAGWGKTDVYVEKEGNSRRENSF